VAALGPTAPILLLMLALGAPLAIAGQPVVLGFILLGAPLLVILASNVEPGPRLRPTFALLGAISYALYVLHFPLLNMTGWIARHLAVPVLASIPATVVALVVFSALMDRYFDRPVRRELTRRWTQWASRRPEGAASRKA
jgi:peptidoglycan/LPS O-acetylase OafA/YrhL